MKLIVYFIIGILIFSSVTVSAQDNSFETKVSALKWRIERITSEERSALKDTIKLINQRLDDHEITAEAAQKLKEDAALKSAKVIQTRVSEVESDLRDLINNKVDQSIYKEENSRRFRIGGFDIDYTDHYRRRHHKDYWSRRTHSYTILSFGVTNLSTNHDFNSINNSEFDFWKSHYYEIGSNSKTRIFKNSGFWYFDLGTSLIYNVLHPKNNQYFVANNTTTDLEVHSENLDKSKFKMVQIIFPAYLEMNFGRPYHNGNQMHYRPNSGFKIGFGGFAGANIKTKQILKYDINDVKSKDVKKGDFNVSNFLYGLNAFVGHRDTSVFMRYYLNPIFKSNIIDQNSVTFGLRFEW